MTMDVSYKVLGDAIIIDLQGDLFIGNLTELDIIWDEVMSENPSTVACDCSKIDFIDSSAIGTFVKYLNNSSRMGIDLVFLDLSENILKVFETARLDRMFKIVSRSDFEKKHGI